MHKLLLPLIAVAAFVLPASMAEAGHYKKRYSHHAPFYGRSVVVVRNACYPRPYPVYYRPARYYYSDYDYGYCAPRARVFVSRPRFAFSFGF